MTVSSTRFSNSTWHGFIEHVQIKNCTYVSTGKRGSLEMARTKNSAVRRGATPAKKVPRENYVGGIFTNAFARICVRVWKSAYGNPHMYFSLTRKTAFMPPAFLSFVRKIEQGYIYSPQFKGEAINSLHYGAESCLEHIFKAAHLVARHVKCITIYNTEICLLRRIRGKISVDPSNKRSPYLSMFLIPNNN